MRPPGTKVPHQRTVRAPEPVLTVHILPAPSTRSHRAFTPGGNREMRRGWRGLAPEVGAHRPVINRQETGSAAASSRGPKGYAGRSLQIAAAAARQIAMHRGGLSALGFVRADLS